MVSERIRAGGGMASIGYIRVSTAGQDLALQGESMTAAWVEKSVGSTRGSIRCWLAVM